MDEAETRQRIAGFRLLRLPELMTATIGRAREIAEVAALLRQEEIRLVTLTGPGGVGKTRLSLEVARTLQEDFADGVFFTSLAPLREQGQVLLALAQTLGIEENSSPELEKRLHEYIGNKHCLLLLDNFEHLPSATGLVADLLADTTRLKILVSSREMLHVYGEHEIVVSPLTLPERKGAEIVSENAAMALFIERAQAVRATLSLDEEQRRAIGEICVQLDGLPLAIELAAARCKLLTPQAVLTRLHHRLSLLTGGSRDLPARQQTLRNTLDWSYDLLNSSKQRFFRQLGVFVGTWTFEAVEAVAGEETLDALAMVTSLVDKSLVCLVETSSAETRFLLLETVREYAVECLERLGERAEAQNRHAAFYRDLAEAIAPNLRSAQQREGLQNLDQEATNIRAALRWSIEACEVETALRVASALRDYLPLRCSSHEERQWFEEVLPLARTEQKEKREETAWINPLLANVLYGAGVMARLRSDLPLARMHLLASVEVAQQTNEYSTFALAQGVLAQLECYPGNYAAARELVEKGLEAAEKAHDRWCRGILHNIYGNIASKQGDFSTAQTRYILSLTLLREAGDLHKQAETLVSQGNMVRLRGKLKTAYYLYHKGLQLFREAGSRWGQLICLNGMGEAFWMQGSYDEGRACFTECLALADLLGERVERAIALNGLGQIALCLEEWRSATEYFKEALRLARELNHTQSLVAALAGLGDRERMLGDWESALVYYKQGFSLVKATDDKLMTIRLLSALGDTAREQGKHALACVQLKQSLYQAWETGYHVALPSGLEALAWLCMQANQPEHGTLLLGAAHNLRDTLQTPLAPVHQSSYEHNMDELKEAIGPAAFAQCWSEGRALLLQQVMVIAVAQVSIAETPGKSHKSSSTTLYKLTARETDVLRLLSEGHSDARIAKMLVVSPRTINTHLRSIYAKLGVSSRSAATRVALEHKLV